MRRSTLIVMAILFGGMAALLFAMKTYTDSFLPEIRKAKDLTEEVKARLEPETVVKLARVQGTSTYVVADADRLGLLLEAKPSADTWSKDPTGEDFAKDMASRLFAAYGPDRPITWIQFRLTRTNGSEAPRIGLEKVPGGGLRRVDAPNPK